MQNVSTLSKAGCPSPTNACIVVFFLFCQEILAALPIIRNTSGNIINLGPTLNIKTKTIGCSFSQFLYVIIYNT